MYPIDKYKFYIARRVDGSPYKVIAVSSFAGKPVRGISVCDKKDTFDLNTGMELAAARCNYKIAQKRLARADSKVNEAVNNVINAKYKLENMWEYQADSARAVDEAANELNRITEKVL